ncbi:hypothetical protein HYH02_001566 [Chlamydomonas schloesseri]|uniref:Uncharacterized protein n=1 Tax=Chlamydomonas schloesseri TaxID=2026947 RepID=A0A835WSV4_9CHLO|nr:hypothetical protein HYH02_001566 [Chlamydomonas schloesseri]|eukprot:KAG2453342.1 hypothetical protein HYH02_001566 [Chlamydomonas schloesseri]
MNLHLARIDFTNWVGGWDSKARDGKRLTVLTRSASTDGQYFEVNVYCTPTAEGFHKGQPCSGPMLSHNRQTVELTALSGKIILSINGTESELKQGEKMVLRPGTPYYYYNGGAEPIEANLRVSPGVPDERYMEALIGLARQNEGLSKTNPIQLFLIYADNDLTLHDMPEKVWQIARTVVIPLAKAMGFQSRYDKYTTKAGTPEPVVWPPAAQAAPAKEEEPVKEAAAAEPAVDVEVQQDVEVAPAAEVEAELEVAAEGDQGEIA